MALKDLLRSLLRGALFIFAALILILALLLLNDCQAETKIAWDGMPVQEVKKNEPLNKTSHFVTASALVLAATVYDVEMTMRSKQNGAKEGNPWARSFVEKGRGQTYAYAMGVNLITMGISYALFKSKDPDTQRKWVVLPVIAVAGHAVGGTLNVAYSW